MNSANEFLFIFWCNNVDFILSRPKRNHSLFVNRLVSAVVSNTNLQTRMFMIFMNKVQKTARCIV